MTPFNLFYTEEGIPTAKEAWLSGEREATESNTWLDAILKESEVKRERQRLAQEYARKLAKLNAQRLAEIRAIQEHARRLGEYAIMLQEQAEERAREQNRIAQTANEVEKEFRAHADKWLNETGHLSDPIKKLMHPSHLKIIGMGEKVLPLILREVQNKSGHWFVALEAVSPKNPVKPEDETNLQKVANAWLEWGKERGYI